MNIIHAPSADSSGIGQMMDSQSDGPTQSGLLISNVFRMSNVMALLDCNKFSQECIVRALGSLYPDSKVEPYSTVEALLASDRASLDIIIYHSHLLDLNQPVALKIIGDVRAAYPDAPLIVLSDANDARQPKTVRRLLEAGALGVIPTKTTDFSMSLAVFRFVQAGGTFVPPDMLTASTPERSPVSIGAPPVGRLTSRQIAVLALLGRGKANKMIAYELSMSESTVKVHVRNIMRKMNATNRTQAVYKAREMWGNEELGTFSEHLAS